MTRLRRCGSILLLLLLGVSLAPSALGQQQYPPPRLCSDPYFVYRTFPTSGAAETSWAICWAPSKQFGVIITAAHFRKSPTAPWMRLFWDARVAEIFVPYHRGSPRFHDIGDYAFGLTALTDVHCPRSQGGQLFPVPSDGLNYLTAEGPAVCVQTHDRGLAWMDYQQARRGEEVVIWGALGAGNYNYMLEWTFRDDGVVQGRVGATAKNLPSQPYDAHMHSPTWRLDIDFNGWWNDSATLGVHTEGLTGPAATDTEMLITHEGGLQWDPLRFNTLRVHDRDLQNGRGSHTAYHLLPLRYGTARHQERFTDNDFWVTLYDPTELVGSEILRYVDNQQPVVDSDVVLWYTASAHHEVRDEDGHRTSSTWDGVAHLMWVGFLLKPHNLFDSTPLYP